MGEDPSLLVLGRRSGPDRSHRWDPTGPGRSVGEVEDGGLQTGSPTRRSNDTFGSFKEVGSGYVSEPGPRTGVRSTRPELWGTRNYPESLQRHLRGETTGKAPSQYPDRKNGPNIVGFASLFSFFGGFDLHTGYGRLPVGSL